MNRVDGYNEFDKQRAPPRASMAVAVVDDYVMGLFRKSGTCDQLWVSGSSGRPPTLRHLISLFGAAVSMVGALNAHVTRRLRCTYGEHSAENVRRRIPCVMYLPKVSATTRFSKVRIQTSLSAFSAFACRFPFCCSDVICYSALEHEFRTSTSERSAAGVLATGQYIT